MNTSLLYKKIKNEILEDLKEWDVLEAYKYVKSKQMFVSLVKEKQCVKKIALEFDLTVSDEGINIVEVRIGIAIRYDSLYKWLNEYSIYVKGWDNISWELDELVDSFNYSTKFIFPISMDLFEEEMNRLKGGVVRYLIPTLEEYTNVEKYFSSYVVKEMRIPNGETGLALFGLLAATKKVAAELLAKHINIVKAKIVLNALIGDLKTLEIIDKINLIWTKLESEKF